MMAFDDANGRFVVFDTSATQGSNETWNFDGATWTQVATNIPIDDILVKAAHDPLRARTVLRGGTTTFEWDGVAWTGDSKPEIFGGERNAARSYGAAIRANLFGFAILEIDYVRPLDRPLKNWFWQFSLRPGF